MSTTQLIHSLPIDPLTGSISVPIHQTSTFVQDAPGVHKGFDYARSNNPTRKVLEDTIALLEKGNAGFAFATGLAAIDSVLKLLEYGDEIIAVEDIYGGAFRLFTYIYQKFGVKIHYVDTTNADNILAFINEKTRFIWIETPTNPTLKVSDIQHIAKIAKTFGRLLVVDNTFASPLSQKPLLLGADIVVHSATKYIGGHSDLVAGLVVTKTKELSDKIKFIQNASGGILGPWDSWLVLRGLETITLRFERISKNAQTISEWLLEQDQIDQVFYPGLPQHPNHEIAKKQQKGQYGGVVSFSLKINTEEAANLFSTHTKYFKLAESLGGCKSLICVPSQMTHKSIPKEKRIQSGICDSLIRISCGIEEVEDLISDLKFALSKVEKNLTVTI